MSIEKFISELNASHNWQVMIATPAKELTFESFKAAYEEETGEKVTDYLGGDDEAETIDSFNRSCRAGWITLESSDDGESYIIVWYDGV